MATATDLSLTTLDALQSVSGCDYHHDLDRCVREFSCGIELSEGFAQAPAGEMYGGFVAMHERHHLHPKRSGVNLLETVSYSKDRLVVTIRISCDCAV